MEILASILHLGGFVKVHEKNDGSLTYYGVTVEWRGQTFGCDHWSLDRALEYTLADLQAACHAS